MKLTALQQQEIRRYLEEVSVVKSNHDELFDHIITGLQQQTQPSGGFDLDSIKEGINREFGELINTEHEKKSYQRLNNIVGFAVFLFALAVYWLTMEPTVSFWDCGEFISAAFKLEVGHQPGAPLFLLIAKIFSLAALGKTAAVAYWVNFSSAFSSAATIMFLFWTITALAAKAYRNEKTRSKRTSIIIAGLIGATAFTFSDTFWFSAVEAEVYALSSLFTAMTFWAILKWETNGNDRWLVLIAFLIGLSTGVHLLNLLAIPAMALVYFYKKSDKITTLGALRALLIGCTLVGIIQFGVLQYLLMAAFKADLLFVNGVGLPFGSGALIFILLCAGLLFYGIRQSIRRRRSKLNLSLTCMVFLLFGFSAYTMIMIRANAKPTINLSNPDNVYSLYNYLGRTNYGSTPLLYGNTFDAKTVENEITGNTYRKGKEKYEISGNTYKTTYDKNLPFPRTYSQKPNHISFYKQWMGLQDGETPTFGQNLGFFASWQVGVMYWRYFLWNFSGRQNDIQGYGGIKNGNWITGIKPLDAVRLGSQQNLPPSVVNNEGHNVFYGLPFLLGIAGAVWLFRRHKQTGFVIATLFFFTGLAIILYLNQDPMQVRERDYAYAGSFYAFAIFIGFGFLMVKDILQKISTRSIGMVVAAMVCFLAVPALMGIQGWNDHDRSGRTTALDWAKNYLNSCAPNAILFTNADNDTYPLWYAQEVEGIRTDVRVICLQFLEDPAFIDQLKSRVNSSAPLPISLFHEQYQAGVREFFPYVDYGITDSVELSDLVAVMTSENRNDQVQMTDGSYLNFLPARKLKLTVDRDQVLDTNTIQPEQKSALVPAMEWSFNKPYASRADLILFDILASNNWKRPIYFATSVSEDTYMGLDKYLYLEGYAYRLLPLKIEDEKADKTQRTNTDVMYTNVMDKLDFSAFNKAKYLDVESRRIVNSTWHLDNTLANNLIAEGKINKAKDVMQKSMRELPMRNYAIADTLNKLNVVRNLYALHEVDAADHVADSTSKYLAKELEYIATLSPVHQAAYRDDVQMGLYVLDELKKMSTSYQF
jgi:hypothetical protein